MFLVVSVNIITMSDHAAVSGADDQVVQASSFSDPHDGVTRASFDASKRVSVDTKNRVSVDTNRVPQGTGMKKFHIPKMSAKKSILGQKSVDFE